MDRVAMVLRSYLEGQTTLDTAAAQLFVLWRDPSSGGWGLYLDDARFTPEELMRARTLERRFHDLVEQRTRRASADGTA